MSVPEFFKCAPKSFKVIRYKKISWLKNASAEYGAQAFVLDNYIEGYIPVKSQKWTAMDSGHNETVGETRCDQFRAD